MSIDLRSDTVTKPTPEMMEYIQNALVGDDVFGEDPTTNSLQSFAADMFGKEAGLFCPSGTMSNQIAIKAQTHPGDEIICESGAHIYYYEGGGIAFNSGCTTKPITGVRGVFTADQVNEVLRPSDVHFPNTSLISIENTCNRGGGKIFDFEQIERIRTICNEKQLKLHLDGARLFNTLIETRMQPKEMSGLFDTISICLSKGLGAPAGSILLGSAKLIAKAKRIRKVMGGGMRQSGLMASAGLYALQNHRNLLARDHKLAKSIEQLLKNCDIVDNVLPVETNIVVFELIKTVSCSNFLDHLLLYGIKAFQVGPKHIRFVTHMDLPENSLPTIAESLGAYSLTE